MVSVPWRRSMPLILLFSSVAPLSGIGAVALVGTFNDPWSMLGVFVFGGLVTSIPLSWIYDRYVPLVVKNGKSINGA